MDLDSSAPAGDALVDSRNTRVPDTNTVFDPPIPTYATVEEWEHRKAELRLHILAATGLFPAPARCELNARTTGVHEGDGYVVENVHFDSYPGFYVTGNLYRPAADDGMRPAIACPHGHAAHGRLEDTEIFSVPARCVSLALQGNVVFSYDMVGYNDSLQLSHDFHGDREYLWGISLLGLQLWNSIRVLDYLTSRDDVDDTRIACTGASGGGTQTFLLAAVDDRVKVSVPAVMVSAHMQGGCLCENVPHLRLETNNVEIAAMAAPRPQLLVSATGDWTKDTPSVEYPAIRDIYALYGAEAKLDEHQVDAGHNTNLESREAMYAWMAKWFHGELDADKTREPAYALPDPDARRVFPDGELPPSALDREGVIREIVERSQAQLESLVPVDAESLDRARTVLGGLYIHTLNPTATDSIETSSQVVDGQVERLSLSPDGAGHAVPAALVSPDDGFSELVVLVDGEGKDAAAADGTVAALVSAGYGVLAVDVFGVGEAAGVEREEGRHFLTFNRSHAAARAQDVVTAASYAATRAERVHLVGVGAAGLWTLLARPLVDVSGRCVVDMAGFDPADDDALIARAYIPGLARAGGALTAGILTAPSPLTLCSVTSDVDMSPVASAYEAAGAGEAFATSKASASVGLVLRELSRS
jgi:dienelactone hydrolase